MAGPVLGTVGEMNGTQSRLLRGYCLVREEKQVSECRQVLCSITEGRNVL